MARLIRLSWNLPIINVALTDIAELDELYWQRDDFSVREIADHARLIQNVDPTIPIILCAEGRVMDRMHRVARGYLDDKTTIPARRFDVTPPLDHIGIAPDSPSYDPQDFEV